MKKFVATLFGLALVCTALSPRVRDELHWHWALYNNHEKDYDRYLGSWPTGHHVKEAGKLYDDIGWKETKSANTVASYQSYLRQHPQGMYTALAKDGLVYSSADKIKQIMRKNTLTILGFKEFMQGDWKNKFAGLSSGEGYCVIIEKGKGMIMDMPVSGGQIGAPIVFQEKTVNENKAAVQLCYILSSENNSFSEIGIAMTRLYNEIVKKHPGWKESSIKDEDWFFKQQTNGTIIFPNKELNRIFFGDNHILTDLKVGKIFRISFTVENGEIEAYSY